MCGYFQTIFLVFNLEKIDLLYIITWIRNSLLTSTTTYKK